MIIKALYTFDGILDLSALERLQESNPCEKYPFRLSMRPGNVVEVDDKFYSLTAIQGALRLGYIEIGGIPAIPERNNSIIDGSYNGTITDQTAGELLSFGDLVYYNSDGKVYKTMANSVNTMICMGIVVEGASLNGTTTLLVDGLIRSSSRFTFTTGGQASSVPGIVYVSASELGGTTQNPPDTYPNVVQIIGYAATADLLEFKPDYTFIEIEPLVGNSSSSSSSSYMDDSSSNSSSSSGSYIDDSSSSSSSSLDSHPYYYGVGAKALTPAQVANLTELIEEKGDKLTTTSPNVEVYYFAYPSSYGSLTSILDNNGLETISDYTQRIEDIIVGGGISREYYIYEFNNLTIQTDFNNTYRY